jgi:putative ABC transport system substrate-binding protein
MRRRDLLALVAGAASSWARGAVAQPTDRLRRLAVVFAKDPSPTIDGYIATLETALNSLGWRKEENLHIDYRVVDINQDAIDTAVRESLAADPEVILASKTPITRALLRATRTIPIVFVVVVDPIGSGFVESLSHPGGNVTGFVELEPSMAGKLLQLLNEIAPLVNRVGLLFNPDTAPGHGEIFIGPFEAAARSLGVTATPAPVHDLHDIETVMAALTAAPGGGVLVSSDSFLSSHTDEIIALAERFRLPAAYSGRGYAARGGLLSRGSTPTEIIRGAASYVDRILKGAKPADLPVQQPTKFELWINLKTAKALGLTVPQSLLASADGVIE